MEEPLFRSHVLVLHELIITARSTQSRPTFQDDAFFGLSFQSAFDPVLPLEDIGIQRSRHDIPLVRGRLNQVEVVYDTGADGGLAPGLVTEVLLHADAGSALLVAAEACAADEWHLFDESVVALPSQPADRDPWRVGPATPRPALNP